MNWKALASRLITIPRNGPARSDTTAHLAAAIAFTVGVTHLMLTEQHLNKALWVGAAFAAGGLALLYTAWELAQSSNPLAWLVGALTLVTMFGFGIASRTVGIPGFPIAKWSPPLITSLALEALFAALCATQYSRYRAGAARSVTHTPQQRSQLGIPTRPSQSAVGHVPSIQADTIPERSR